MTKRAALLTGLCLLAALTAPIVAAPQLAGRPAEEWIKRLERPERVAELKIDEILARLELKPGARVADIGAGAGVFSYPLARAVGPTGTVYAVEIDKGFLDYIEKRAGEQQIENIRTVLGKFEDPNLPARELDLAFFHDVLHHIDKRAEYLKALAAYLKPTGRIAIVELDATHPTSGHRDDPKLQVSREQAAEWMAAAGFQPEKEVKLFEDKWFIIYARRPNVGSPVRLKPDTTVVRDFVSSVVVSAFRRTCGPQVRKGGICSPAGTNFNATPLLHHRWPVGGGPSSKT